MKTALQSCTENLWRHAYAVRRQGRRDQYVVQSLVAMSYVESRKIGRAALKVLHDIRKTPSPQTAA